MNPLRIFISSVQGELAEERATLRDYIQSDALIRRFFEVFLFEDAPASDRRPDQLYLDEVERCDIYVGLFGLDYGNEDEEGVSPTEREFDRATAVGVHRLIFVKGTDDDRHPKMRALVRSRPGAKQEDKRAMPRAKSRAMQGAKRARLYCRRSRSPCFERVSMVPFRQKHCRLPLAIPAGWDISEGG